MSNTTQTLQPIETTYAGHKFRSRLEARWAVFFDELGIVWEYEPEGYKMPDGTCYMPDFWLPYFSGGMYVEVKPEGGDYRKAARFVEACGLLLWKAEGLPRVGAYEVFVPRSNRRFACYYLAHGQEVELPAIDVNICLAVPFASEARHDHRMFWLYDWWLRDNSDSHYFNYEAVPDSPSAVERAAEKACAFRYEYSKVHR